MEELMITMAVSVILATIKNPKSLAKLESAMFKVYSQIDMRYPKFHGLLHPEDENK